MRQRELALTLLPGVCFLFVLAYFVKGVTPVEVSKDVLYRNIKALCDKEGISIYQLERKAGLTQHTIEKCHTTAVAWERVFAVAKYFGVSMDFIIGRTNNPYSHKQSFSTGTIKLIEAAEQIQLSDKDIETTIRIMRVIK